MPTGRLRERDRIRSVSARNDGLLQPASLARFMIILGDWCPHQQSIREGFREPETADRVNPTSTTAEQGVCSAYGMPTVVGKKVVHPLAGP